VRQSSQRRCQNPALPPANRRGIELIRNPKKIEKSSTANQADVETETSWLLHRKEGGKRECHYEAFFKLAFSRTKKCAV